MRPAGDLERLPDNASSCRGPAVHPHCPFFYTPCEGAHKGERWPSPMVSLFAPRPAHEPCRFAMDPRLENGATGRSRGQAHVVDSAEDKGFRLDQEVADVQEDAAPNAAQRSDGAERQGLPEKPLSGWAN